MAEQNLDWFTTPSISLFSAAPKSGKTHTIEFLIKTLWVQGRFKYGFVFSMTALMNGDYHYLPQRYVYGDCDDKKLTAIMQHQRGKGGPRAPPAFLILDDCIGAAHFNSKVFTQLFTTYRHYNLTLFITTQYIYKVPPVFRDCSTFAFIFKQGTLKSIKALWESFGSMFFRSDKEWAKFVNRYTTNYGILVAKTQSEVNLRERFMQVKAPAHLPDIELNF